MEIIKIKASDLYEKKPQIYTTCNFTSRKRSELGKFLVIIWIFNQIKQWISIYKKWVRAREKYFW